jgi:sterol desaturase/sphingolipid hydroxylase (fatty acid hydroxylase superfamily)
MAQAYQPKNKGSKKLFASPILENLTRTHISVPLLIFGCYAAGLLFWSVTQTNITLDTTISLFIAGFFAFTLFEYLMHRFIFHMTTYNQLREKIQYIIHGVHHEYPKDKERLAMPPLVSITIATILLLLFQAVMGDYTFSFLPGFITGYSFYLTIHYMVHAYQPPDNFLKMLWVNHSIHHYKEDEHILYGVSSPLWDYVFGSIPKNR